MHMRKLIALSILVLLMTAAGCGRRDVVSYNRQECVLAQEELLSTYPWLEDFFPTW